MTSLPAAIDANASRIASLITERQFAADPSLAARFGDRGRVKCTEDALRHLEYLSSAAANDSDSLFADYVAWAKILLARLRISDDDLAKNLHLLREAVRETLPMVRRPPASSTRRCAIFPRCRPPAGAFCPTVSRTPTWLESISTCCCRAIVVGHGS